MTANDGSLKEFQLTSFELVAQMGGGYPVGGAVEWWVDSRSWKCMYNRSNVDVFVVFNIKQ